jgi:broad specificity phosphatase PhoE
MPTTELILIRHGESVWNVEGRWQGQADPPLSERGRSQARDAVQRIAGLEPEALYSSTLRRAHETALILGRGIDLEPRVEPRLREFNVGVWSGLTKPEIEQRWPGQYARFSFRELDFRPGGGESPRELMARVHQALDEIAHRHAGQRVLLVSHGGVAKSLSGSGLENLGALHLRRGEAGRWKPADSEAPIGSVRQEVL